MSEQDPKEKVAAEKDAEEAKGSDEEAAQEDEEAADEMAVDQYYAEDHIEKVLLDSSISVRNVEFQTVLGQQSFKRYNIHFLEDDVIIYTCGNRYQTFNLTTHEYKTYPGLDSDGIGSIAVHPSRKFFAVAEKGTWPLIYIREYPTMRTYRILRKGTECMYAHCEFSQSGEKLVSLGGAPDFTITVWNWLGQKVVLKAKAFSQEVFRASFSPYSENVLTTCGQGHIRFWNMAWTFTGLKLQGEGGKFGQLELSDCSAFYELPDGKIICGTEQGTLILWEGVLVKAHLVLDKDSKAPLHKGMIEVILFEDKCFITAGADGFIKWWPLNDIDQAEGDDIQEVAIRPTKEVSISTGEGEFAHIVHMVKGKGMWLVQDAKGRLWQLDSKDFQATVVREFHAGAITDLAVSDNMNMAISTGEDGLIKVWDYLREAPLYQVRYEGRANCIDLLRRSDVNKGRIAAVGYDTGVVRILGLGETRLEMASVFKAHDESVVKCKYAPAQTMMVTASSNGELFFFEVNGFSDLGKYEPLCLVQLPDASEVTDLKWDGTSSKILVSCKNGWVYELGKPNPANVNNRETYLVEDYPMRSWKLTMMEFQMKKNQKKDEEEEERKRRMRLRGELPPEEEEEEEDWDPEAITVVTYMNDESDRFLIASEGQFGGFIYLCKFGEVRPQDAYPIPAGTKVTFMQFSNFGELLIIGFSNGEIRLMMIEHPNNFCSIKQHDAQNGSIAAAYLNFNEQFLISAGADGMVYNHAIDKYMIQQEAKFVPLEGVEGASFMPTDQIAQVTKEKIEQFKEENPSNIPEVDPKIDGLDDTAFAVTLRIPEEPDDITDTDLYSIQKSKLRTEEDMRLKLAEEKKDGVRQRIDDLRSAFTSLLEKNKTVEEAIQVADDDFNIDPEYFELLSEKNNHKIEETKKEVAYGIEVATVKLNKLKDKFYSVLHFEKFTVKALRTHSYVTTFRVPKMSEFLTSNLESFKALLGAENGARDSMDFEEDDVMQNMGDGEEERKATDLARKGTHLAQPERKVNQTEAERKREERKIERERRKKEIENLEKQKTNKANQDQNELNKIQEAKNSFGMFMLKRDDNYQVPESQQTNFTKKRQQMVLLEASIYKLKMDFNTKIQELKLRKKEILTRVEVLYTRIGAINEELKTPEELVLPQIDEAREYPQKFFEVNDQDIDEFKVMKTQREAEDKMKSSKGKSLTAAQKKKLAEEREMKAAKEAEEQAKNRASKDDGKPVEAEVHPYRMQVVERKNRKNQDSRRLVEFDEVRRIELVYEKEQLNVEVNKLMNDFDEEIREMQKEKYRLESDLKNAEMKLILLFEELILLQSMESRDQELMAQLGQCKQQSDMISQSIKDITTDLAKKTKEIDDIREKQDQLMARFHGECPPDHEKYAEVSAFFEKRSKRRKKPDKRDKNNEDEDNEDDDGEEEEEQEDFEDEDDSDGDDEDNLQQLADGDLKIDVIESLRDEKLDLHDLGEKILTHMHQLESKRKKLDTQSRQIKMNMDETMEEIADFQKEKMAKMNQLCISVVLKVRQIQNLDEDAKKTAAWFKIQQQEEEARMQAQLEDGSVDGDEEQDRLNRTKEGKDELDYRGFFLPRQCYDGSDSSVLFTRNQLLQLIERQRELDIEVEDLKNKASQAKINQAKVMKENRVKDKMVEDRKREYEERQMLRFGNLVDLDSLEVSGPSQVVLDLQRKFTKTEQQSVRSIEDEISKLQATQRQLTSCIQQNTNLLDMIRKMAEAQQEKNKQLDNTNKAIFVDEDNEEKRKMQALKLKFKAKLEEQARKIENIKMEINLYKRKGGHIYTKVTTNRRVNQQGDQ